MRWILVAMITSMIFFPDSVIYERPEDFGIAYEDVRFSAEDGTALHGWYLKAPQENGVILHLHGNAGNISARVSKMRGWLERGYSVFLVDYRGYGKSSGKIRHGEDLIRDARGALHWLAGIKRIEIRKIVFYGESVGTYPALFLATEHAASAVILEAPFTSFRELARKHYAFMPDFLLRPILSDFVFDELSIVDRTKCPLFILHGIQDEICPVEMAQRLFEKAPEPKGIFLVPGGDHNRLAEIAGEDFWEKPFQFFQDLKNRKHFEQKS
ncbi:MAG: alpha/beta hydrolase [Candidatus Omnitrophota bacterium]